MFCLMCVAVRLKVYMKYLLFTGIVLSWQIGGIRGKASYYMCVNGDDHVHCQLDVKLIFVLCDRPRSAHVPNQAVTSLDVAL